MALPAGFSTWRRGLSWVTSSSKSDLVRREPREVSLSSSLLCGPPPGLDEGYVIPELPCLDFVPLQVVLVQAAAIEIDVYGLVGHIEHDGKSMEDL